MRLEDVQRVLHRAMRGEIPADDAAAALGSDARRLAIYGRFARHHVQTALEANLPTFAARAGDRWQALVDDYYAAHPPADWALNHAAAAFPGFVERCVEAGEPAWLTPFQTCLAQAEWALYRAIADPTPLPDPRTLSRPVVNPTLLPMRFPYPVADVMLAHRAGEHPPDPAPAEAIVLFYQSPRSGNGRYQKARPDLLFALKAVDAGLDPAAAAEVAGQPLAAAQAAFDHAAEVGVIIRPARSPATAADAPASPWPAAVD